MVQWLRRHALNAGGTGSVTGQGIKIPLATWCGQKEKKESFIYDQLVRKLWWKDSSLIVVTLYFISGLKSLKILLSVLERVGIPMVFLLHRCFAHFLVFSRLDKVNLLIATCQLLHNEFYLHLSMSRFNQVHFYLFIYLFIYFWLFWIFIAAQPVV